MFNWIKNLFKPTFVSNNIHIWLHVDGKLSLENETRPGNTIVAPQGPVNSPTTPETPKGDSRTNKGPEESIEAGFFSDTQATEVSFGTEIELPPKADENKGN